MHTLGKSVTSVLPSFDYLEVFLRDDHSWRLHKERKDSQGRICIQGFTRPPPGIESSQVMFKVRSLINADMSSLLEIFHTNLVNHISEFAPSCTYARVAEQVDSDTYVVYQKYKLPFPLAPRDMVVAHTRIHFLDGRIALIEKSVPHPSLPEDKHTVRAKTLIFLRLLEPVDGGVLMTVMQWCNLGGKVPSALVDLKALDALMDEADIAQNIINHAHKVSAQPAALFHWPFWR